MAAKKHFRQPPYLALLGAISKHEGRNRGGVGLRMRNLGESFRQAGAVVEILTANPLPPANPAATDNPVKNHYLGRGGKLAIMLRLARLWRRRQPEALFAFDNRAAAIAVTLKRLRLYSGPLVSVFCSPLLPLENPEPRKLPRRRRRRLERILAYSDKIIAISRGLAEECRLLLPAASGKIKIIYNGVVEERLPAKAGENGLHPWLRNREVPCLIAAGRLFRSKDFAGLIKAFQLARREKVMKLLILGEGEERGRLEKAVADGPFAADIALPGFVDHIQTWFAAADLFVSNSRYEGFGNVIVEALAAGCPVVTTDCPYGPREILGLTGGGRLVPVADEPALAATILAVLAAPPPAVPAARLQIFTKKQAAAAYLAVAAELQ